MGILTERLLPGLGVDVFVRQVASFLSQKGFEVTIFTLFADPDFSQFGVPVEKIFVPFSRKLPLYQYAALKKLPLLRKYNAEIWLIMTEPFYPFAYYLEPSILFFFGNSPPWGTRWKGWLNYAYACLEQNFFSFPRGKKLVAISLFLLNSLPSWLREKSEVIYPGANHYPFSPYGEAKVREEKQRLNIPENSRICLYAGRLNPFYQPYKGIQELAGICEKWKKAGKPYVFLAIGYGNKDDEEWLTKHHIFVRRMVPWEKMPLYFQMCDLYVSASKWEGLNLPLLEAGYFARPCVVYDLKAHREIVIPDRTGILIPRGKKEGERFQEAVEYLLADDEKRTTMGQEAKKRADQFRWEKSMEQILSLIQKTAG
ncbi:MAG: glycosyltransferase family 4 protein [bacterium JZ-2024 1]